MDAIIATWLVALCGFRVGQPLEQDLKWTVMLNEKECCAANLVSLSISKQNPLEPRAARENDRH